MSLVVHFEGPTHTLFIGMERHQTFGDLKLKIIRAGANAKALVVPYRGIREDSDPLINDYEDGIAMRCCELGHFPKEWMRT